MPWVRLADDFADHPKLIAAGPLAGWLWVCALAYANKHLTDGAIPGGALRRLVDADDPSRLAARLVEVGLWERTSDGYRIHDYGEYQPSAESVRADRAQAAERQRNLRERRKFGHDSGRSNGVMNSVSPGSPVPAVNPAINPDPAGVPLPPTPSPQAAEGERVDRRRRRDSEIPETPKAAPELAPLDPATTQLWRSAIDGIRAAGTLNPGNLEQVLLLEPLGRDDAGALHLRAPPGLRLERFQRNVALALADAGDAAAQGVVIRES